MSVEIASNIHLVWPCLSASDISGEIPRCMELFVLPSISLSCLAREIDGDRPVWERMAIRSQETALHNQAWQDASDGSAQPEGREDVDGLV